MSVKHKQEPTRKNFGYKQKITILLREGALFQKYVTLISFFYLGEQNREYTSFPTQGT